MAISIRQIHPAFAGEVGGVDLRRPLSLEEVAGDAPTAEQIAEIAA